MRERTLQHGMQCITGWSVCSRVDHDLAAYLSVLLSTALTKIDLDGCSLDRRPFRDLLRK